MGCDKKKYANSPTRFVFFLATIDAEPIRHVAQNNAKQIRRGGVKKNGSLLLGRVHRRGAHELNLSTPERTSPFFCPEKEDEGVGPTRVPIPKQMICEFGVGAGHTLQKIKEQFPTGKTIVGFDSFEGLPENWIPEWRKGSFSQGGEIPKEVLGENVSIIKGLFSDTVPKFFETTDFKDVELLLHIDCDLYRSTKDVLGDGLATTLKENKFFMSSEVPLYVAFDELIDYPTYEDHEIKALYEFLNENKDWLECVVIGADGREDTGTKLRFYYPDEICPHRVLTLFRPTKRARKEWEAKEKEKRAAASRWNFCAMS